MSLWIPKLQWKVTTFTGTTTSGSPTVTWISSTASLEVGMKVTGTGIANGSHIDSKTANTITLNHNATSSGTVTLTAFVEYEFEYPPVKDSEDKFRPNQKAADSLSGIQQVQTNFLEAVRDLEFWFVNQADANLLMEDFYMWAYKGNSFIYYPDKDEVTNYTMELENRNFTRVRQVKKHPNFKYSIQFSFKRIVE